ncbi:DUF5682 family protein [Microlunatus flavus]|uniref:Uncharacterized protein n=1 Tax=Microlunatus flavus TaxID=1036181 RepID=A0A1H9IB33_9ACTN|nr:DUF5682 family protein [Microlunatus flavus]SEQ71748.1 hypothetical protein SAMN05421756_105164 [Microlunatus flavus]
MTLAELETDVAAPPRGPVEVFGVRHHGPGSARSLVAALDAYDPDCVLVEGPPDADPLLRFVGDPGLVPPVALLAYAPEEPRQAAFWPFAEFSPEWQAILWARRREVEVGFCDLPAAMTLAPQGRTLLDEASDGLDGPDGSDDAERGEEAGERSAVEELLGAPAPRGGDAAALRRLAGRDPLGALAQAGGYDDAERWWEDVVEGRLDSSSPFPLVLEAMGELRRLVGQRHGRYAEGEARREAMMRQTIRAALKRGRTRVAVVCGAWHAPVLTAPLGPAAPDARTLRGAAKRKVVCTWVPWTHRRLAASSGYGAGITSPGWYAHLFEARDAPVVRWLTAVAGELRGRDLPVSSASVIEAVRLAETLATLRGRPLAGLTEVTDATRSVLCDGDELALRFVTDRLVVGERLGEVPAAVPTVPLEADLAATTRRLRLKREPAARSLDLDLRRGIDRERSQLFHRLRLLELAWAAPATSDVQATGTFRETWRLQWHPELAIAVVEAAVWGTTVEAAATARVDAVVEGQSLVELARTVERCLLAALPDALDRLLAACADQAARDADVLHLMEAVPALARAARYGDVRGTDTTALRQTSEVLVRRTCAGLARATTGLDDDSAVRVRDLVDAVHAAVGLLAQEGATDVRREWLGTLAALVGRADLAPLLQGRLTRLLVDAELVPDAPARLHRALSYGSAAAAKAAWVEGFFTDGAVLLVHDPALRGLLDGWVAGLGDEEFTDVLPLVRRTFGTFSTVQRRALAQRLAHGDAAGPAPDADGPDELVAPVLATVETILEAGRG